MKRNKKTVIPILDIVKISIPAFLLLFRLLLSGKFHTLKLKGSRLSGKTFWVVLFILIHMLKDNQASWVVYMFNKSDHSDRTMNEFGDAIERIDDIWPGYAGKWTKVDTQVNKEYRFVNNGNYQIIKFVSLEELGKKGLTPPPSNYWAGRWGEELSQGTDRFKTDFEEREKMLSLVNTFNLTAIRFLKRWRVEKQDILKNEKYKPKFIYNFQSWNPENEEEPLSKHFDKHLPDDEETLRKYGTNHLADLESKTIFFQSNYLANTFLDDYVLEEFSLIELNDPVGYLTDGLGISASTTDTVYARIWNGVRKRAMEINKVDRRTFTDFRFAIDVGEGGAGKTTLTLLAYSTQLKGYTDIGYWDDADLWLIKDWDPVLLSSKILEKISDWEKYFPQMIRMHKGRGVDLIIDRNPYFEELLKQTYHRMSNEGFSINNKLNIKLFNEKHYREYKNETRIIIFEYLMSMGLYTPNYKGKAYIQFKQTKINKQGKVIDGFDDHRQGVEIGLLGILPNLLKTKEGSAIPKELKDLIYKIQSNK